MIGRLILLIAFLLAAFTLVQLFKNTPKAQIKSAYWKIGLSIIAMALILLAVTGRIHWIGAMIGALIPFVRRTLPYLVRYFPMLQQYWRSQPQAAPKSDNSSEVQTRILKMTLNHDNDELHGEVISGPYNGNKLDQMDLTQLNRLLEYCHQQEKDSAQLLMTYLNHRFGNQWQQQSPAGNNNAIDVEAAYAILGLQAGASKDEIIKAHRRMMQKNHPDRGGSDYLAAQINQAKDLLMSKLA